MRRDAYLLLVGLALGVCAGCGVDGASSLAGGGPKGDADGDGISDVDEGRANKIDTDGDGFDDYVDPDSDGDTILDEIEAGDKDLATPPVDSDNDGVPDFRDLDSDSNDILDITELQDDPDGDGIGNYADMDNDGDAGLDTIEIVGALADCDDDGLSDPTGTPDSPADCDGDGVPDFNDNDADDDLILDSDEGIDVDSNLDGILDRYDLDSDGDGFLDIDEAGDDDLFTLPVDTDNDTIPDFRDLDSDADGLSDADELAAGSSPSESDTDGDGVTDLVEVAAGTDPNDSMDNPAAYGDFVFIVPYEEATTPPDDTLEFRTNIQIADLYFLIDRTGSMNDEHTTLASTTFGVSAINDALKCQEYGTPCNIDSDCANADQICFNPPNAVQGECVQNPQTANGGNGCIPDLWTGVGHFEDCNEYRNTQHLQANPAVTAAAVNVGTGGGTEPVLQAPACVADPTLCPSNTYPGNTPCSADPSVTNPVGCAGYRPEAVRLLLMATDAGDQAAATCGVPHDASFPGDALAAAGINFVGLPGTSDNGGDPCGDAQSCLSQIGIASGTVNGVGQPFLSPPLDTGGVAFRDSIIDLVLEIANTKPLYVTIDAVDEPNDAGDALQFLDYLEVNVSGTGNCTNVNPTSDENTDGFQDAFPSLLGGTPVCWDVHPVDFQSTTPATQEAQLFRAKLTVLGDGSPLDSRDVYFLVPPLGIVVPPPPQ